MAGTPSSLTGPYLTLGGTVKECLEGGSSILDLHLFDPAKDQLVTVKDKTIPKELANTRHIGSSHGWGLFRGHGDLYHSSLCLSDFYTSLASNAKPKIVPLPPFATLPNCQTQLLSNVAMSSDSPSEEEDSVVAVKFFGRQISLCRPLRDLHWTNLELPFTSSENVNLTYSKKDGCFYSPTPGGNYLCSFDLHLKDPKFLELVFRNLPKLPQSEYEFLYSCSRAEHWVESSSGDSFLVQWYSYVSPVEERGPIFMVFREEKTTEGSYMCYTEDIGDLCIFLSDSQPFCVEASSCTGLKPNSIYVMPPEDFGVYDLATRTCCDFEPPKIGPKGGPVIVPFVPYWIPPLYI